jgi:hypothetical protein
MRYPESDVSDQDGGHLALVCHAAGQAELNEYKSVYDPDEPRWGSGPCVVFGTKLDMRHTIALFSRHSGGMRGGQWASQGHDSS